MIKCYFTNPFERFIVDYSFDFLSHTRAIISARWREDNVKFTWPEIAQNFILFHPETDKAYNASWVVGLTYKTSLRPLSS